MFSIAFLATALVSQAHATGCYAPFMFPAGGDPESKICYYDFLKAKNWDKTCGVWCTLDENVGNEMQCGWAGDYLCSKVQYPHADNDSGSDSVEVGSGSASDSEEPVAVPKSAPNSGVVSSKSAPQSGVVSAKSAPQALNEAEICRDGGFCGSGFVREGFATAVTDCRNKCADVDWYAYSPTSHADGFWCMCYSGTCDTLTTSDYKTCSIHPQPAQPTATVTDVFGFYDDNGNGEVTIEDLIAKQNYMKIWGEHSANTGKPLTEDDINMSMKNYAELWESIKGSIKALDINQNGHVSAHDLDVMIAEQETATDMLAKYKAQLATAEKNLGKKIDISYTDLDNEVAAHIANFNKRMTTSFDKMGGNKNGGVIEFSQFEQYLKDVTFMLCFLQNGGIELTAAAYSACIDDAHVDFNTAGGIEMAEFAKLTHPGEYNTFQQNKRATGIAQSELDL